MIFYDCATAPSPRRARIVLAEKQVPHEVKQVDLMQGEQLSDAFKAINPSCTVPVLELEDGTILTENAGIVAYLEAAFPDQPLLGVTPQEKGLIASWNAIIEFQGLMAVADALRNGSPAMRNRATTGPDNYAQIPELAERGLQRISRFLDRLNQHLHNRDYLVGERFSYADITAVVVVDFARIIKIKPDQEHHPDIIRWRSSLNDRSSLRL